VATAVDIGSLIVQTQGIHGGRPRIAGTGVTVRRVVGWYKLGLIPEEIADRVEHLSLALPRGGGRREKLQTLTALVGDVGFL
jgi:uncharacterized protein (DUF433 family)